ncbi:MAG: endopeptidase La [Ruminococcus sp.]|nr:endopeptidase La [Ruminococcus sp.]
METYGNIYNLPVLPLRGLVVFPKTMLHFDVGRKQSQTAINIAMKRDQLIFLVTQKNPAVKEPKANDLFSTGVVARIVQVLRQPDDTTRVIVEGLYRAYIDDFIDNKRCLFARVCCYDNSEQPQSTHEIALIRQIKGTFDNFARLVPKLNSDILFRVATCDNGGELADFIAGNALPDFNDKQLILETTDVIERLETLLDIMNQEIYILQIEEKIGERAKERIDKSQREYFLREQKSVIEEELGESDNPTTESEEYKQKIKALKLPEDSEKYLLKECDKLSKMPMGSHDVPVICTYLDTILDLPWNNSTKDNLNLKQLEKKLDKNHYGLNKVKERIVEQMAVRKLNPEIKGQIICLVGPPGVGKTSIAQSLSEAIGRKSARIALGGVRDEAEIRGHRKTYIGAMPGRIINAIKTAGTNNPIIILDEIDKLGADYKGDPTSALLEVLDGEQNNKFVDHYIDIPFDLSKVMFITTANDASRIPAPLFDRMEVIEIGSYTREEKFNIAKKHLVPKQIKECGLTTDVVKFTQKGIYTLIDYYTREAGVRRLEQEIAKLIRKFAVEYVKGEKETVKFTDKNISDYLGAQKFTDEKLGETDEIGVVNGLAWTAVGGTLLPIEVSVMPGDGKIILTGSLGDVMQESAKAAVTCIRAHSEFLNIDSDFYKEKDIHIHAPEGAVPKDGPSAGITMTTAIYSALSMRAVRRDIAMTGEITLRGKILKIGGLKEKTMAAYKAGIKKVYIPKSNLADLEEIDSVVKDNIEFIPCEYFTEVINDATVEPVVANERKDVIIPKNSGNIKTVRQ